MRTGRPPKPIMDRFWQHVDQMPLWLQALAIVIAGVALGVGIMLLPWFRRWGAFAQPWDPW